MLTKFNQIEDLFNPWQMLNTAATTQQVVKSNIYERNGGYEIKLLAPGFLKEDLKIDVKSGVLKITGKHVADEERPQVKEYHLSSFERSFSLPGSVKNEAISAIYENGVLRVVIPTREREPNTFTSIPIS